MDTLPETSRLSCPVGEYQPWSSVQELLSQLIEVTSLDKVKKPPLKVYRPDWLTRGKAVSDPREVTAETTGPVRGHAAIMAKAQASGHLRVVPEAG